MMNFNSIKKIGAVLLSSVTAAMMFTGCGNSSSSDSKEASGDKLSVVTTIFPEYDWAKEIAGDKADITMLLDNGVDLHSYQPSVDDIMKISDCDVFVYVGGESDKWVDDALKEATNKDMKVINLMEVLKDSVKEEEVKEGMQAEEEEEEGEEGEEEEVEYDEHVWLSLANAQKLTASISDALCEADKDNADTYKANLKTYNDKLAKLEGDYKTAVDGAKYKTLIFGDRFPFRYMTDDLGLDYFAAFAGCSAESEASFETITFLANKADELDVPAVMTIESSDQKIAKSVNDSSKNKERKILTLDSMQATTSKDVEGGETYLKAMESNLEVLKEALN